MLFSYRKKGKNKLWIHEYLQIDVSFLCVCPLIGDDFRHSIVKIAVVPRGAAEATSNLTMPQN